MRGIMAKRRNAEIEKLIEEITVDCYNEYEQLSAFEVTINDAIDGYAKAFYLDEPVYLVGVNFDQGIYAGLRAQITRQRKKIEVALLDLEIDREEEDLQHLVEAYKYFVKKLG